MNADDPVIVNRDVNPAEVRRDPRDDRVDGRGLADVAGERLRRRALFPQERGRLLGRLLADVIDPTDAPSAAKAAAIAAPIPPSLLPPAPVTTATLPFNGGGAVAGI